LVIPDAERSDRMRRLLETLGLSHFRSVRVVGGWEVAGVVIEAIRPRWLSGWWIDKGDDTASVTCWQQSGK
jgi:hypothetical protein